MSTETLQIGDVVRKRSGKDPYPPLFRVVEFLPGGSEVLVRPVSGGSLVQLRTGSVAKHDPETKENDR